MILIQNNVSILLGNGEGSFGPANNFGAGIGPRSIAVGDFNEDEALDIATVNAGSNNISILLGNGNGTFDPATNFPVGSGQTYIAIADFNEDEALDIATVTQVPIIYLYS